MADLEPVNGAPGAKEVKDGEVKKPHEEREGEDRQQESVLAKHLRGKSTLLAEVATTVETFKTRFDLLQQGSDEIVDDGQDGLQVADLEPEEDSDSSIDHPSSGWRHHAKRIVSVFKGKRGIDDSVNDVTAVHSHTSGQEDTAATPKDKQLEEALPITRSTLESVTAQYEAFRDTLLEDKELIESFNNFFADRQIRPLIEQEKEKGNLTEEQADQYMALVHDQLGENLREDPTVEWQLRHTHYSNNLCRDPQSFKTGGECMPGAKASEA